MTRQVVRPIGIGYFIGSALIRQLIGETSHDVLNLDKLTEMPSAAKAAGAISIILWLGIATFGRLIGWHGAD